MELIKAPNEFLEKQVKPFDFENMDAGQISNDMVETMLKYKGIGLASAHALADEGVDVAICSRNIDDVNSGVFPDNSNLIEMDESIFDEIKKQYVTTAKAKGLSNNQVLYQHVFRNAM